MRSRGLVVAIAVVLAVAAAAAVILYTQGVKEEAVKGGDLKTVIVSTVDIRANEPLDPLLAQDIFKQIEVPQKALVAGAVTDIRQLAKATTTSTIFANEQIPITRLSTGPRLEATAKTCFVRDDFELRRYPGQPPELLLLHRDVLEQPGAVVRGLLGGGLLDDRDPHVRTSLKFRLNQ